MCSCNRINNYSKYEHTPTFDTLEQITKSELQQELASKIVLDTITKIKESTIEGGQFVQEKALKLTGAGCVATVCANDCNASSYDATKDTTFGLMSLPLLLAASNSDKKNKYQARSIKPVRGSINGTLGGVIGVGVALGLGICWTQNKFSTHDGNLYRVSA